MSIHYHNLSDEKTTFRDVGHYMSDIRNVRIDNLSYRSTDHEIKGGSTLNKYYELIGEVTNTFNEAPITILDDVKNKLSDVQVPKFGIQIKQRTKFLSIVQFLSIIGRNIEYVIYAGASSCDNLYQLMELFPYIKFILIDPNKIDLIISGKSHTMYAVLMRYGITYLKYEERAQWIKYLNEDKDHRIYIIEDYFTDELCEIFAKLSNNTTFYSRCALISDIGCGIRIGNVAKTGGDVAEDNSNDIDILCNLAQHMVWAKKLNPMFTMLKFIMPKFNMNITTKMVKNVEMIATEGSAYDSELATNVFKKAKELGIDFIKNYKNKVMEYFKGVFYVRAWGNKNSNETQFMFNNNIEHTQYDIDDYIDKLCYYNVIARQFEHHKNQYINQEIGFDNCNDCALEAHIWDSYIKANWIAKFDVNIYLNLCEMSPTRDFFIQDHGHFFNHDVAAIKNKIKYKTIDISNIKFSPIKDVQTVEAPKQITMTVKNVYDIIKKAVPPIQYDLFIGFIDTERTSNLPVVKYLNDIKVVYPYISSDRLYRVCIASAELYSFFAALYVLNKYGAKVNKNFNASHIDGIKIVPEPKIEFVNFRNTPSSNGDLGAKSENNAPKNGDLSAKSENSAPKNGDLGAKNGDLGAKNGDKSTKEGHGDDNLESKNDKSDIHDDKKSRRNTHKSRGKSTKSRRSKHHGTKTGGYCCCSTASCVKKHKPRHKNGDMGSKNASENTTSESKIDDTNDKINARSGQGGKDERAENLKYMIIPDMSFLKTGTMLEILCEMYDIIILQFGIADSKAQSYSAAPEFDETRANNVHYYSDNIIDIIGKLSPITSQSFLYVNDDPKGPRPPTQGCIYISKCYALAKLLNPKVFLVFIYMFGDNKIQGINREAAAKDPWVIKCSELGYDVLASYNNIEFAYIDGDLFLSPYGFYSASSHFLINTKIKPRTYQLEEYDGKNFYFKQIVRTYAYKKNPYSHEDLGFDNCNDCALAAELLADFYGKVGSSKKETSDGIYKIMAKLIEINNANPRNDKFKRSHGYFFDQTDKTFIEIFKKNGISKSLSKVVPMVKEFDISVKRRDGLPIDGKEPTKKTN